MSDDNNEKGYESNLMTQQKKYESKSKSQPEKFLLIGLINE